MAVAGLFLFGCGGDRNAEVGPGERVRLSESWTMVVPDGWDGVVQRYDRATLGEASGLHSDISLMRSERNDGTFIWVHVIADEELGRKRIEARLKQEGARLVRATPEVTNVVVELERKWVFYEYRRGPAGEHLWLHVIYDGVGPWMPGIAESELGEHLMELLQLSRRE